MRIAVTDGASESFLAGRWARHLANVCGRSLTGLTTPALAQLIGEATESWRGVLQAYESERESRGEPLQWYESRGLARGDFATLLIADFKVDGMIGRHGQWQAAAVGDTYLFQVSADQLVSACPAAAKEAFGIRPDLISSKEGSVEQVVSRAVGYEGQWRAGDTFYMATDALSEWIVTEAEAGRKPWQTIDRSQSAGIDGFADWIARQRDAVAMRNDDVTLVRLRMR